MREVWKDIKGYEGLYSVSNTGKVKSLRRDKIMSLQKTRDGYLRVGLRKNGQKLYFVHRLVAQAFIPNPNEYSQINHIDECKTNNSITNLEWCTAKYNCNYGNHIKNMIAHTDYSKINYRARHEHTDYAKRYLNTDYKKIGECTRRRFSKAVVQYTLDGEKIREYSSTREAARALGVDHKGIVNCCNKRYSHSHGYLWKYV